MTKADCIVNYWDCGQVVLHGVCLVSFIIHLEIWRIPVHFIATKFANITLYPYAYAI